MASNTEGQGEPTSQRPSFSGFWKRGKAKLKGKEFTFVGQSENDAGSAGNGQSNSEKAQAAKDKSQHRRAQVRKAQIQHRQRKANYVKSLELDITQYRDMLSRAQAQVKAIETENNSIRSALHGAGAHIPESVREEAAVSDPMVVNAPEGNLSTQFQAQTIQDTQTHEQTLLQQDELSQQQQLQPQLETQQQAGRSPDLFSDIDVNDLTVSLGMDGIMGTPCFHIQSSSSGSSSVSGISTPWTSPEQSAEMTVGQEQLAINFILALEHCCWSHFSMGDFWNHSHTTEDDKNHTLMASSYIMAGAPETLYTARSVFDDKVKGSKKSLSPQQLQRRQEASFEWQVPGSGISLESLHGLAQSLNSNDDEVAPVQAWFELVRRYDLERLVDIATLDLLKREFVGVVKCVGIGAAMERLAFESVATRVMGMPKIPWSTPLF